MIIWYLIKELKFLYFKYSIVSLNMLNIKIEKENELYINIIKI